MKIESIKIGDLIAWESQAQGSWKTKIGRVTRLPKIGTDSRTTEGKVKTEILQSYRIDAKKGAGKARDFVRHRAPYKIGRCTPNVARDLTLAECLAMGA